MSSAVEHQTTSENAARGYYAQYETTPPTPAESQHVVSAPGMTYQQATVTTYEPQQTVTSYQSGGQYVVSTQESQEKATTGYSQQYVTTSSERRHEKSTQPTYSQQTISYAVPGSYTLGGSAGAGEQVSVVENAQSGGYYTVGSRNQSVATETSRVVGHEYGEQRVISVNQRVDETRQSVVSERYVEHEIRVPKKIIREEVIEKVIIIPETVRHEEVVDDIQIVREKIIEVSRPTIVEKVVEIPEIEYVERIVEVPERVIQEKIIPKEVVTYEERVVYVNKPVIKQIPRVVPEITYRDVPVERTVEKVEWVDKVVVKEVPVPQYVEKMVPQEVLTEKFMDVPVKIPVPVEAEVTYEYHLPQMKPRYAKATYPVYLPRFIEVPIATELLNEDLKLRTATYLGQISSLTKSAASLCEIEGLAAQIMKTDFQSQLSNIDLQQAVMKAWQSNALPIDVAEGTVGATVPQTKVQGQLDHLTVPYTGPITTQPTFGQTVTSTQRAVVDQASSNKKSKKSSKSNKK